MSKIKIITTNNINNFKIQQNKFDIVDHFIFSEFKMGDCLEEVKRRIALGSDTMIKLDKIMKDKGISLKIKKRIVEALSFTCGHFWIKEERIEAFEMWTWRNRVPWTQIKGQRLTYLRHIMREISLEKMLRKIEERPSMSWLEESSWKSIFHYLMVVGGQAAAHEVEEFIWNDHFVIPVYSTGGAAGGNYGVPVKIFEMPPPVNKEDWELLSDKTASPEDVAKAIVNILMVIKQSIAAHTNKTQELKAAVGVRNKSRRKQRIIGELSTNRESRVLPTTPSYETSAAPVTMEFNKSRAQPNSSWLRRVFGHRKS
ncbi:hypothetical protein LAZ67_20001235 [Cordylochernes scorpioides]|uniref:Uncharacterized protein n=1 Tax=Cordylochernes scorpioides TaxID=51811 RepID=A0ABY6LMA6_9ARAC|nr:hypothetical protein LAZ67_20001235 [Cordylochernes scorpioides]